MNHVRTQLKLMRYYFVASLLVFIVGIVLGAGFSDLFQNFIDTSLKGLEQLSFSIADKPNPQWSMFWLIFWNNVSKTVLIIVLGAFFGIMPLFFLLVNGMLLGYLGARFAYDESMFFFIKAIVPHGIIEIPAIIIAAALGLRLGVLVMKSLASLMSPNRPNAYKEELLGFVKTIVPIMMLLIITLALAALIESTFTYWLVKS